MSYLGDVLRTVLTLYVENEDLPLPTLEEVLICNQATTAEEVNTLTVAMICTLWYLCDVCTVFHYDVGDVFYIL